MQTTELIELRNISQNIDSAIDTISTCQYILGLCAKVKEYVENKKFYPAIKVNIGSFGLLVINLKLLLF